MYYRIERIQIDDIMETIHNPICVVLCDTRNLQIIVEDKNPTRVKKKKKIRDDDTIIDSGHHIK